MRAARSVGKLQVANCHLHFGGMVDVPRDPTARPYTPGKQSRYHKLEGGLQARLLCCHTRKRRPYSGYSRCPDLFHFDPRHLLDEAAGGGGELPKECTLFLAWPQAPVCPYPSLYLLQ